MLNIELLKHILVIATATQTLKNINGVLTWQTDGE